MEAALRYAQSCLIGAMFVSGCVLPLEGEEEPHEPTPEVGVVPMPSPALDGPTLQVIANHEFAAWGVAAPAAGMRRTDEGNLYLYGETSDSERILAGGAPAHAVGAVLLADEGACLGVKLDLRAPELDSEAGFDWQDCRSDFLEALAPAASAWADQSDDFLDDRVDGPYTDIELNACTSACGSTQGYAYAGETAYSNGSSTGTGNACNGSDTYGYRYQCVQFTERVHKRADWAGNAYPGYWTQTGLSSGSTSQGPYYKSLLPLANGSAYAAPQAGDVVVWQGGTYGHVQIITAVGTSTITVLDQNRHCGDQQCTLTYATSGGRYTLGAGTASGSCGAEGLGSYTIKGYLRRGWDFGSLYGLAPNASTGTTQHNWWPVNAMYVGGTISGSVGDITDYITIDPGPTDPQLVSPPGLNIPAAPATSYGYRNVQVYIQSNCTNKQAQLFWKRTTDQGFDAARSTTATISGSGWQSLHFYPSTSSLWSGTIDQIRIDPAAGCSSGATDTISIQSVYFWK